MADKSQKIDFLLERVRLALQSGSSEVAIKSMKDGFFITEHKDIQNPTRSQIEDAVGNTVLYEFGGIEMHQGQCRILRVTRKMKI